ncbi:AraC family transcriptional regulator [Marinomonas sp. THO17]|uniref:AraC family transcriptional regulator n=1 Tax=Marinomonas sp. THO17 TaxID=3149048 RepID=UPI00336BAEEF
MDVLSQLLTGLKINSTTISRWELHAESGVHVTDFSPAYFLSLVSGPPIQLDYGEQQFILNPKDSLIALREGDCRLGQTSAQQFIDINQLDWQGTRDQPYDIQRQYSSTVTVKVGEAQQAAILVGVAFDIGTTTTSGILKELPSHIYLSKQAVHTNQLMNTAIDFLIEDKEQGYYALALHLAEVTLVSAIRSHILRSQKFSTGLLKGLSDPKISLVLKSMYSEYDKPWTLSSLAKENAMSRSTLAAKFFSCVGMTPMSYLNLIRAENAQVLLKNSELSINVIAEKVGFGSDRVLRSVFKKHFRISPLSFRQSQRKA